MAWLDLVLAGFTMVPAVAPFGGFFVDCVPSQVGAGSMHGPWVEVTFDSVLKDFRHLDAVLFDIGGDQVWIPRSWLRDDEYDLCSKTGTGTFEIPENLAMQKGLI